jgi:hypothetical protein
VWQCAQASFAHCSLFLSITFSNLGNFTMSHNIDASVLHKKAATEHEAAAKHHHKAAECHDQKKVSDAKGSSKSAMDCCNTAQKHSTTACECSAK